MPLVSLGHSQKRFAKRTRHEFGFGPALLLLDDNERLAEIGIALCDLFAQKFHLCMLASKAQHSSSRRVGMVQISREQAAQVARVFASAAAPLLVQQEFDTVDVFEEGRTAWVSFTRNE